MIKCYLLEPDDKIEIGDELLTKGFLRDWKTVIKVDDENGNPIKCKDMLIIRRLKEV